MSVDGIYSWWAAALIALLGGGAAQIISIFINYLTSKKQIEVSDDADLRKDLMGERKQLNIEISNLSKRCDNLEQTNHELNETIIVMQREHFEKEKIMQYEIDTLRNKVNYLQEEIEEYKKGI